MTTQYNTHRYVHIARAFSLSLSLVLLAAAFSVALLGCSGSNSSAQQSDEERQTEVHEVATSEVKDYEQLEAQLKAFALYSLAEHQSQDACEFDSRDSAEISVDILQSLASNRQCYDFSYYPPGTPKQITEGTAVDFLHRNYGATLPVWGCSQEAIRWVEKNIFNVTDERIAEIESALFDQQSTPWIQRQDGMYCWIGESANPYIKNYAIRNVTIRTDNLSYWVEYDWDITTTEGELGWKHRYAKIQPKVIDGTRYWTVVYNSFRDLDWGNDNKYNDTGEILFNNSWVSYDTNTYNNYLAEFCGNCNEKLEDDYTSIENYLSESGFEKCYFMGTESSGLGTGPLDFITLSAVCCVTHKNVTIGETPTTVLLVTCRGTQSLHEAVGDLLKGGTDKLAGEDIYDNVYDFEECVYKAIDAYGKKVYSDSSNKKLLKDDTSRPIKVIITGHSLGGAAANALAARLDSDTCKDKSDKWFHRSYNVKNIYAYTFAAIKVLSDDYGDQNIEEGYENIHNLYNWKDSYGPYGSRQDCNVSAVKQKFGHTETFEIDAGDSALPTDVPCHGMATYLKAVKDYGEDVKGYGNRTTSPGGIRNSFELACEDSN